jgi:GDSL-like Lipase/Acylhydrolase family
MPALKRKTSRLRRAAVIVAALGLAAAVSLLALLAVDVYLHGRYERSAGFNVWGYRGPSAGRKKAGEYRVVVLGGSTAYGYGVSWDEAMPAALERTLRSRAASPVFTVENLAYNNEGAYSFKPTLIDYEWLDPDLVLMYEGYNDLAGGGVTNVQVFRHDSPIFRLTGYMPIFPIIFKEKSAAMLNGGDVGALYRPQDGKTVFHVGIATRTAAGVLDATASVARSLEAQLGHVAVEPAHRVDDAESSGCSAAWRAYCRSMAVAVEYARQRGRQVIVVTQPYLANDPSVRARHMDEQAQMRGMLARKFGADPDVRAVDLGNQVNLEDPTMAFDHVHLTPKGNAQLVDGLAGPVLEIALRRKKGRP